MTFIVESDAFASGEVIPRQHTRDGADQSPPLRWSRLPEDTKSLALIVEDRDAPGGIFTHWVLFNLPPSPPELPAGAPRTTALSNGAYQGRNDFRRVGYSGPAPLTGPPRQYSFTMYALDSLLILTPGAAATEVRAAMRGHVLDTGVLIGTYHRRA